MRSFDYDRQLALLMTPSIMRTVASIYECRGMQTRLSQLKPNVIDELREIALIQSTGASNRIENIKTSDVRLREIVLERVKPRSRDEQEILGYRNVLALIHESYEGIPVTPGVILQLHRDLYRGTSLDIGGRWKDSDNIIQEVLPDGTRTTRFVPTSALETPAAVEDLCNVYRAQMASGTYEPLLVTCQFIFDFVSIHPFNDGNGRMSRLLTLLLLYKSGFSVGRYISIEHEIETTKEEYYTVLKESSAGWHEGTNDSRPFVAYLLGTVLGCYRKLMDRVDLVGVSQTGADRVRAFFDTHLGAVSKRELSDALPGMSLATITRSLQQLEQEGVIEKTGAARATKYRRRAE